MRQSPPGVKALPRSQIENSSVMHIADLAIAGSPSHRFASGWDIRPMLFAMLTNSALKMS